MHNIRLTQDVGDLTQNTAALTAVCTQTCSPHNIGLAQDVGHLTLPVKQPHTVHDLAAVLAAMHRLGFLGEKEACRVPTGLVSQAAA